MIFGLFIMTLLLQVYALLGSRVIRNIDATNTELGQTYDEINRMQLHDPKLMAAGRLDAVTGKSVAYEHLLWKSQAIDAKLFEAFTSLYQWNALWAAPVGWLHPDGARGLWGFDEPVGERRQGRIRYGTETIARTALEALQGLILPVFYATLGAWVRLIRDRRREAAAGLTDAKAIDLREPLMLGAIVGSVLGFFYTSDILGGQFKTVPLVGLSFFVGYQADWLFSKFDGIASTRPGDDGRGDDGSVPPAAGTMR